MVRDNLNPTVEIIGHPADDVRPAAHALARGRRDPARELRRARLQHAHPEDDPLRRGAREGSSIIAYEPDGEAAALYRDLAKEVLNGEKAR